MKTIKTYEVFVNEEINLKKALATGALAVVWLLVVFMLQKYVVVLGNHLGYLR